MGYTGPCESALLYPLDQFQVEQLIFLKIPVKILNLLTECEFLILFNNYVLYNLDVLNFALYQSLLLPLATIQTSHFSFFCLWLHICLSRHLPVVNRTILNVLLNFFHHLHLRYTGMLNFLLCNCCAVDMVHIHQGLSTHSPSTGHLGCPLTHLSMRCDERCDLGFLVRQANVLTGETVKNRTTAS